MSVCVNERGWCVPLVDSSTVSVDLCTAYYNSTIIVSLTLWFSPPAVVGRPVIDVERGAEVKGRSNGIGRSVE